MFDPNLPQENTPADAVQMRSQLNGLKALIDAIQSVTAAQVDSTNTLPPGSPANASVSVVGNTLHFSFDLPQGNDGAAGSDGGPGADGPQGPPFAQAVVDGVNTLEPWESATVDASFDGSNVRFTFGIPRGNDGISGAPGNDGGPGEPGPSGEPGPQGPPFATAVVDSVTTLEPWESATVDASFDGSDVHFTFGIQRGNDGSSGADGMPGEVSQQQLDDAIATTSANSDGVSTLDLFVSDPPTQAEMQDVVNKLNELIVVLRRV